MQLALLDEPRERLVDEFLAGTDVSKISGRKTKNPPLIQTSPAEVLDRVTRLRRRSRVDVVLDIGRTG